jgi:hypothetical protein
MEENSNSKNSGETEFKTFGIVNVKELHKSDEEREIETENRTVLRNWMTKSMYAVMLFVVLGFWKKYFFYLAPLPPVIAFFSFKIKTITERVEKNNPL